MKKILVIVAVLFSAYSVSAGEPSFNIFNPKPLDDSHFAAFKPSKHVVPTAPAPQAKVVVPPKPAFGEGWTLDVEQNVWWRMATPAESAAYKLKDFTPSTTVVPPYIPLPTTINSGCPNGVCPSGSCPNGQCPLQSRPIATDALPSFTLPSSGCPNGQCPNQQRTIGWRLR